MRFRSAICIGCLLSFLGFQKVIFGQAMLVNVGQAVRPNVTSQGVGVSGNCLYVADYRDGLSLYNISSITNPVLLGCTVTNYGGYARRVVVSGNFAYVANDTDGLRIYDVSSPSNPINVGHINDLYKADGSPAYNGADAWDLTLSGSYLYVANGSDGLRIYDVSNPANPLHVGHAVFNNGGQMALGIAISGSFAFIADYVGLSTYSIFDPSSPQFIGTTNCNFNGGYAFSVAVSGNYAYVANEGDGMRVFSISDPLKPVLVGHINNGGSSTGTVAAAHIAVSGNYAYLANNTDGVRVYDISNPTNPVNVSVIAHAWGGYAKQVLISGNYAYVANSFDGVRIDLLTNLPQPLVGANIAPNSLVFTWPITNAFYQLEATTNLVQPNWITLTNIPDILSNQTRLILSRPTGNQFYRLKSF
ncbi:MAG TPA: hypothetical protein VMB80_04840 [Candidatus Acidoferrum sp.]|nr:hypothetical protein [Candidatus Acidoferrum sp.]